MTRLVFGLILIFIGLAVRATRKSTGKVSGSLVGLVGVVFLLLVAFSLLGSSVVIIEAGEVGVQHGFGKVPPTPLLSGIRFVPPWSQVERFSSREEPSPQGNVEAEAVPALPQEQLGQRVAGALLTSQRPERPLSSVSRRAAHARRGVRWGPGLRTERSLPGGW